MTFANSQSRAGISLMEVLISIGVIALGIFGVASLIPLAQYRVAQGTDADRQSALGQSAVAEFRIRNMGNPDTWWYPGTKDLFITSTDQPDLKQLLRRGYCLDPLGRLSPDGLSAATSRISFPLVSGLVNVAKMPRISLKSGFTNTSGQPLPINVEVADDIFTLRDELSFDRPTEDALQPNRKYFMDADGRPLKTVSDASTSWFATITPTQAASSTTDKFILSIVMVKNRVRNLELIALDESFAIVTSPYTGEIILEDPPSTNPDQYRVADLRWGDWLLLAKVFPPNPALPNSDSRAVYRWTKIIGADEKGGEGQDPDSPRSFTIANDDFFAPDATRTNASPARFAIFVRGVEGVVERSVRLDNSTAWD